MAEVQSTAETAWSSSKAVGIVFDAASGSCCIFHDTAQRFLAAKGGKGGGEKRISPRRRDSA